MATADLDDRLATFRKRVVGRSISEGSWSEYERWITRFEGWMSHQGVTDPNIGDIEAFDGFLADGSRTDYPWENGQGRHAVESYAYRSRVTAMSAVKKWVRREYDRRIPEAPGDICIGEPEPFDPTYLDPNAIGDTIASAENDCSLDGCGVALRLSYDAILRASELVRVSRDDIDLSSGTVYVHATKGSQNAEVGLDRRTVRALRDYLDAHPDQDRLFRNSYDRAWRPSAWATHVWREHEEAGSHAVGRHSPIMHRLEGANPSFMDTSFEGGDFGDTYRRARHSNPSMTVKYARVVGIDVPEWAGD